MSNTARKLRRRNRPTNRPQCPRCKHFRKSGPLPLMRWDKGFKAYVCRRCFWQLPKGTK